MSEASESLIIKIKADINDLKTNCDKAKSELNTMGTGSSKSMDGLGSTIKKVGTIIAGAFTVNAIKDFGSECLKAYNEQVEGETKLKTIMTERIGASAAQIQSVKDLAQAQKKLGVVDDDAAIAGAQQIATFATSTDTINTLIPAMENLAVQQNGVNVTSDNMTSIANLMGKALMGQTGALTKVGISFDEAQEKVLKYGTESERAAMLSQVITDNVGHMNEAMAQTPEGKIAKMNQSLDDVKKTLGSAIAPIVADLAGKIAEFTDKHQPQIEEFVTTKLPAIEAEIGKVIGAVGNVFGFIRNNMPLLTTLGIGIGIVTTAMGIQSAIQATKAALNLEETTSLSALIVAKYADATATMAALAPYILIVAAIAAVIAIIVVCVKHWDIIKKKVTEVATSIKGKVTEMVDKVKDKFEDMKTGISNKISSIKESVSTKFNEIKSKMLTPVNKARDLIKTAIDKIKSFFKFQWSFPKLKMPHFSLSGKFSLSPPSVPHMSVQWYAKGGVFNNPTLFNTGNGLAGLGENGAEAVVPLENNTEWLDKLATMLASKLGAGSGDIVLKVGQTEFGRVAVNSINTITKQTGSLPIKLA